jgi:hypothetical protein
MEDTAVSFIMDNLHRLLIHCCENCHEHQWCTRHEEARYQRYFQQVAEHLTVAVPQLQVFKPTETEVKFLNEERVRIFGPQQQVEPGKLGSFEVYLDNLLIFSKHKTNRWPRLDELEALLKQGVQEYARSQSFSNLIQHLKIKF